jgi:hypothetical protein
MVYNFAFLVMAAAIFFGGPKFWPDKKTRMLHSYVAFLVALAGAALVRNTQWTGQRMWGACAGAPIDKLRCQDGSDPLTCMRSPSTALRLQGTQTRIANGVAAHSYKSASALCHVQVEGIVNQAALPGREYAFCVWVAASVAAGAADALAGSVLNGEAAACKCNYVS